MRQHVVTRLAYPFLTNQVLCESRVPLSRHWRLYLSTRRLSFSSSGIVHNSGSVRSSNPFLKSTTKGMAPPRWERLGRGRRWCLRRRLRRLDACLWRGGGAAAFIRPRTLGRWEHVRERAGAGCDLTNRGILGPYKGMMTRSLHVTSRV